MKVELHGTSKSATVVCGRLGSLWRHLLPVFLLLLLCSCLVLGTAAILPELLSGAPLLLSRALAAALCGSILFNLAAAVLRATGTAHPCGKHQLPRLPEPGLQHDTFAFARCMLACVPA